MFELKLFNDFNSRCVFLVKEYCHMLYAFVICMFTVCICHYNKNIININSVSKKPCLCLIKREPLYITRLKELIIHIHNYSNEWRTFRNQVQHIGGSVYLCKLSSKLKGCVQGRNHALLLNLRNGEY